MNSRLRCRYFRVYSGKLKPRCNKGNPCVACTLLHFVQWYEEENHNGQVDLDFARRRVETYVRSNPR